MQQTSRHFKQSPRRSNGAQKLLCCLSVIAVLAFAKGASAQAPVSCEFCTLGTDGTLLSELDNPRVRTSVSIGHPAWAEIAICSNSGPQSIFYTEDFLVQVATVPAGQSWDVPETLSPDDSRSTTLCDPTSPDGEYLDGQSVPIETKGVALGNTAVTSVTWTKRQTTTRCNPTAQNCIDVASANLRLNDETLLQPIRLVVAYPEGSEPVLSRTEARALFDDYPYANISIVDRTPINGQFHVQASRVESGLFPSNIIEGHFRPDAILSQCGVQTRIVAYSAVPIPAVLYEGEYMINRRETDSQCVELVNGPTNAEINAQIPDGATYCPQPLPADQISRCPSTGSTSGIHMAALNWLMGTADALGYVDPVSGTSLSSSTTAPSVITVVITKHAKPTTCGRDLEGFANQKRVLVGYNDASETTLTHELFHAMTDSSDHVSATRLGSLHDRMLMKAGAGTGKVIPGCNRWRATGGSPPAGCDAELEAQAFAADPNAFGCSMLRSRLGGVVDPPPAGPDIGAMEPPSPPSELVFTYGPDPGAPEVEFTDQTATNGEYSIVVPPGWTEITSPTVLTTSWANVGTEIAVDVYIPETVPNPWWVGAVAFAIDLPGAGFNNAWLGQVDLTPLPRGEWSTVSVQVGQALQEAILGDLPGMRIRIVTNVPDTFGFDPVLLDNLRFAGTLTPRTIFHQPGSNGTDVSTSAFLSFDVNGDWTSPQSALTQNLELVSDGTASLEVPAGGTKFIESRAFSTAELPQLGATLSVDVYVPDPQPNPWWVGAVQAYLSCPSANLHNAWLGQVPLSGLFPEEFNQLSFTLPASVPETLAGVASDCRFTLSLISNSGSGAFLFDRLGFLP